MSDLIIPQRRILTLGGGYPGTQAMGLPVPAEEPEVSPWDKVQQQSDAVELIGEVKAEAQATIEALKKADNKKASGDTIAEKGKVALVRQEIEGAQGIGFNSERAVEHQDSYLDDPKSGTINEFHTRNKERGTSLGIVREEDSTVYTSVGDGWQRTAVEYDNGTYEFSKSPHLTEEAKAALAMQMALQMGGGGNIF